MAGEQSPEFKKAAEDSRKLHAKPSDGELLKLYGLFKHGQGEDINSAPQPGTFDFKGKAKLRAWKEVVDEGISAEEAQKRYVELVEQLKEKYGYDG